MRLKTKLVLAITALVFLTAGMLSLVYVFDLLHSAVQQSYDANRMVANQVQFSVRNAIENQLTGVKVDPDKPGELRNLAAEAVRHNAALQAVVESVNRYSLTVYDINIGDSQNQTILSTNPDNEDKPLPPRPNYDQLLDASPVQLMREVFGAPRVFDVVVPLENNGQPFVTVHVGVRTTLLRAFYAPWLVEAFTLMGFVLGAALLVAFLLSNLALQPMEQISLQLDAWSVAELAAEEEKTPRQDMAVRVSHKIERFGQRMRNVEEVFSALKENLDQILGNLQDGILLFTGDGRAVLVSESARRFLTTTQESILGLHARDIFDRTTVLGRALSDAFEAHQTLIQEEVLTETGRRIQVSLDFIQDPKARQGLGALLTLHDLESAEAIESEIEISRRLAAIGRLTSGVGHEVKNPINAIVVHVELLKSKLTGASAPAIRHLDVIEAEIHRLDRVVQLLVDFSRPVELRLREQDLRAVIGDVLALASAELSTHNVKLSVSCRLEPLVVNIDADLLKQAALNVIQNGAQSMPDGGTLRVELEEKRKFAVLRIADEGYGIPEEISGEDFRPLFHDEGRRQRHRISNDLSHSSVALREHRSTIESRPWNRVSAPNSACCPRVGTPVFAAGNRAGRGWVCQDEVACQERRVAAAAVPDGLRPPAKPSTESAVCPSCEHGTEAASVTPGSADLGADPVSVPLDTDTDAILEAAAKPAVRRRKPPVRAAQEAPDSSSNAVNSQQAGNDTPPEEPAIGVLSSGDPPDLRRETIDTISDTERGLSGLGRSLNTQEQKTASQIRQFIRQAKKLLGSGDVDGAHTLAAKAKVLLGELSG